MYESFYNLSGKPFQLNPDPSFFYKSRGHQRAMAYLRYGLQQGQGFIVVTGNVGTGKTMLVGNLFKEIEGQDVAAIRIVSTNVKDHDLLRLVAAELGMAFERASKATLIARLERRFRELVDQGQRVLLVVDEAQNLPWASLEELRMLSNFEYDGTPLVQSFLLGQREFRKIIRSPGLEQLRQRVIAAYHLRPLSETETKAYIMHRLTKAGWDGDPVIEEALFGEIYRFTRGVPRRINTLMDRLLLNGAIEEVHTIGESELKVVTGELGAETGVGETGEDSISGEHALGAGVEPGGDDSRHGRRSPDNIDRLEYQIAAMQRTMQQLTETLVQREPERAGEDPRESEKPKLPVWTIAFSVAAVTAVVVGSVLLYVLLSRGG